MGGKSGKWIGFNRAAPTAGQSIPFQRPTFCIRLAELLPNLQTDCTQYIKADQAILSQNNAHRITITEQIPKRRSRADSSIFAEASFISKYGLEGEVKGSP